MHRAVHDLPQLGFDDTAREAAENVQDLEILITALFEKLDAHSGRILKRNDALVVSADIGFTIVISTLNPMLQQVDLLALLDLFIDVDERVGTHVEVRIGHPSANHRY